MVVHIMRRMVSDVYDGVGWKRKVELMSDDQVIAIYYKFLDRGKFDNDTSTCDLKKTINSISSIGTPYVVNASDVASGISTNNGTNNGTSTDDKKNDIFRGEQLSFGPELFC